MGIGKRGAPEESQLGAAQRFVARLAAAQVVVEDLHEVRRRPIGHPPHRRHRRADAGGEKGAAEALHAFAAHHASTLGLAGAQDGEIDAVSFSA